MHNNNISFVIECAGRRDFNDCTKSEVVHSTVGQPNKYFSHQLWRSVTRYGKRNRTYRFSSRPIYNITQQRIIIYVMLFVVLQHCRYCIVLVCAYTDVVSRVSAANLLRPERQPAIRRGGSRMIYRPSIAILIPVGDGGDGRLPTPGGRPRRCGKIKKKKKIIRGDTLINHAPLPQYHYSGNNNNHNAREAVQSDRKVVDSIERIRTSRYFWSRRNNNNNKT